MPKQKLFTEQLREAVLNADKTRYRISVETGIAQSILSRFINQGAGLSTDSIDKLCECLGLHLESDSPRKPTKRKGK